MPFFMPIIMGSVFIVFIVLSYRQKSQKNKIREMELKKELLELEIKKLEEENKKLDKEIYG